MPKPLRALLAVTAVAALGIGVAGCGDDGGDSGASSSTTAAGAGDPSVNPCAKGGDPTAGLTANPPAAGAADLAATGTEFSFAGLDALDGITGSAHFALTLHNIGEELHEATVARIDDGETRSVEDLTKAVRQGTDPTTFSSAVAETFACPGATSAATAVDITQPGRYVVLCQIPVGLFPQTKQEDIPTGELHAERGMYKEFTVK